MSGVRSKLMFKKLPKVGDIQIRPTMHVFRREGKRHVSTVNMLELRKQTPYEKA